MTSFSPRRLLTTCITRGGADRGAGVPGAAGAALGPSARARTSPVRAPTSLKNAQQTVWDPSFNTSTSKSAWQAGTQGTQSRNRRSAYTTSSAATGLESWGANKHVGTNFSSSNAFIGASEPPNALQKAEIESYETTPTPNTLVSIPTFQTAIAVIVNLPPNCVATSKKNKGRLELNNVDARGIFRGTITKWSQIKEDGDALSGSGCNPDIDDHHRSSARTAPGTTHIFKKYLSLINGATLPRRKRSQQDVERTSPRAPEHRLAESRERHAPTANGDTAIDTKVASNARAASATRRSPKHARTARSRRSPGTGGPGTARFWVPIQNNGLGTTANSSSPTRRATATSATVADSNCKNTEYTNGEVAFPPSSALEPWDEVTTSTTEKKYTLCSIVVELAFTSYSAVPRHEPGRGDDGRTTSSASSPTRRAAAGRS